MTLISWLKSYVLSFEYGYILKEMFSVIMSCMLFQGLIKETETDIFSLTEDSNSGKGIKGIPEVCEEEETESITASTHDQREEELLVRPML